MKAPPSLPLNTKRLLGARCKMNAANQIPGCELARKTKPIDN